MSLFSFLKSIFYNTEKKDKPVEVNYDNSASITTVSPARSDFDRCLDFVLGAEGGLANVRGDRGGITKFGISTRSYPDLDVRSLSLSEAKEIYRRDYWLVPGFDKLTWPTSIIIFDLAVNSGVPVAKRALKKYGENPASLLIYRRERYRKIIQKNPSQKKFEKGWSKRLDDLKKTIGAI